MNLANFTIKSQEAVHQAIQIAEGYKQQAVETGHLLKAMMGVDENIIQFLMQKQGVNVRNLSLVLDRIIETYPKVSGGET